MYDITYIKINGGGKILHAVFDDLEDAQLWWDTIYYLRGTYLLSKGRPI